MAHEPYAQCKVTVVPEDNVVVVDGVAMFGIDTTELPEWIHAIQWDGAKRTGHIEYRPDSKGVKHPSTPIVDFTPYNYLVDRWDIVRVEKMAEQERLEAELAATEHEAELAVKGGV